jgi:hypothetical protein
VNLAKLAKVAKVAKMAKMAGTGRGEFFTFTGGRELSPSDGSAQCKLEESG